MVEAQLVLAGVTQGVCRALLGTQTAEAALGQVEVVARDHAPTRIVDALDLNRVVRARARTERAPDADLGLAAQAPSGLVEALEMSHAELDLTEVGRAFLGTGHRHLDTRARLSSTPSSVAFSYLS